MEYDDPHQPQARWTPTWKLYHFQGAGAYCGGPTAGRRDCVICVVCLHLSTVVCHCWLSGMKGIRSVRSYCCYDVTDLAGAWRRWFAHVLKVPAVSTATHVLCSCRKNSEMFDILVRAYAATLAAYICVWFVCRNLVAHCLRPIWVIFVQFNVLKMF